MSGQLRSLSWRSVEVDNYPSYTKNRLKIRAQTHSEDESAFFGGTSKTHRSKSLKSFANLTEIPRPIFFDIFREKKIGPCLQEFGLGLNISFASFIKNEKTETLACFLSIFFLTQRLFFLPHKTDILFYFRSRKKRKHDQLRLEAETGRR